MLRFEDNRKTTTEMAEALIFDIDLKDITENEDIVDVFIYYTANELDEILEKIDEIENSIENEEEKDDILEQTTKAKYIINTFILMNDINRNGFKGVKKKEIKRIREILVNFYTFTIKMNYPYEDITLIDDYLKLYEK